MGRFQVIYKELCINPFRLFFPLGLILSAWGVSYWIWYALGSLSDYPKVPHAEMMLGGFLIAFISGFLMTAFPRFTDTAASSPSELFRTIFLVILLSIFSLASTYSSLFYIILLVYLLNFLLFLGKRFWKRKINPPSTFIFVELAFIVATLGAGLHLYVAFVSDNSSLSLFANQLLYQDFILALIVGIGGRLIPGILGWNDIVQRQKGRYENRLPYLQVIGCETLSMALVFVLAVFLTFLNQDIFSHILRSLLISYFAFRYLRLHKWPISPQWNARMLWLAMWHVVLGCWIIVGWPEWRSHFYHLMFIGGFGLSLLLIGSRVTLAHSGDGLGMEQKKWPYIPITVALILAALTRISVVYLPQTFNNHLAYASSLWIIACAFWIKSFSKKIFMKKTT